jgi:DNA-binding Lrp family transcriptional regulator
MPNIEIGSKGEQMEISGLDDIDNRIIELLRENARISYSEIGNAVGKSRVAVKTRIDQLEKKGIIRGYHA